MLTSLATPLSLSKSLIPARAVAWTDVSHLGSAGPGLGSEMKLRGVEIWPRDAKSSSRCLSLLDFLALELT